MMKRILIFYRHYNISGNDRKGRPSYFSFESCFENLINTLNYPNIELHVIMDGDEKTNNFIHKFNELFTIHPIEAGNDASSFFQTWEIAKSLNPKEDDLLYFLENDYLHLNTWVPKLRELYDTYDLPHYVSLYDHNDKYFLPMYENLTSKIFTTPTHHWRTTPSTCGSFIVNSKIFYEDFDIHTTVKGDHNKFLLLNKERSRVVITPIPGLSTHCMEGLMSPTINWNKIGKQVKYDT